jgi:hypothetical protein
VKKQLRVCHLPDPREKAIIGQEKRERRVRKEVGRSNVDADAPVSGICYNERVKVTGKEGTMKQIVSGIALLMLSIVFVSCLGAAEEGNAGKDYFRLRIETKIKEYVQRLDEVTGGAHEKAAVRAKEVFAEAERKIKELQPAAEAAMREIESSLQSLIDRIEKQFGGSRTNSKGEWI